MDPNAIEIAQAAAKNITIYELVMNADPIVKSVMALLAAASVACWAIIFEKAIGLSRFGAQVWRFESFAANPVISSLKQGEWLSSAVIGAAVKQSDPSAGESRHDFESRIEKAMRLAARAEINRLQPRVRFLATVGSTAPFVGLFGTVWGIMNSFTAIAAQKDTSLAVVAPGIAEALFATALGLVAAIPAVIAYNQITGGIARMAERLNLTIARLSAEYASGGLKPGAER